MNKLLLIIFIIFMSGCSSQDTAEEAVTIVSSLCSIFIIGLVGLCIKLNRNKPPIDDKKDKDMREEENIISSLKDDLLKELETLDKFISDSKAAHSTLSIVLTKKFDIKSKDESFLEALAKCNEYATNGLKAKLKAGYVYQKAELYFMLDVINSSKTSVDTSIKTKERIINKLSDHEKKVKNFLAIMPALRQQVLEKEKDRSLIREDIYEKLSKIQTDHHRYVQEVGTLKGTYKTILSI